MWKKIVLAVAVVLVGVAAIYLLNSGRDGGFEAEAQERYELLANAGAKLREAGTARVTFRADLRTDIGTGRIAWAGTSRIRFADKAESETDYSEVTTQAGAPVRAKRVFDGEDAYYTSASFVPPDRRRWINSRTTAMFWPDPLASPDLGLTDYPLWQEFLDDVQRDNAIGASTEELTDVAGAPHEYRLTCTPGEDSGCPPPWGTALDQYFNQVPDITWSIWLDEAGRPRRVDVANTLWWNKDIASTTDNGVTHRVEVYQYRATFELSGFGEPVTVTAPPADQVSQARVVQAKK